MAWTTPKTWSSEPLTSTNLNSYVRDNQSYLKGRVDGDAVQYQKPSSFYSTTSTSYVDVDTTNMTHTITTTGGDVRITFSGYGYVSGGTNTLTLGYRLASTDYIVTRIECVNSNDEHNLSFSHIVTGLAAGSHTFVLRWYVSGGTGIINGLPLFDVREDVGVIA